MRAVVPEPLEITEPLVKYEFIRMPDSTGFGDYTESGQVIPVRFAGVLKETWNTPAELQLFRHVIADVARLPVLEIVSGQHLVADLTLGLGQVAFDYLAENTGRAVAPSQTTSWLANVYG